MVKKSDSEDVYATAGESGAEEPIKVEPEVVLSSEQIASRKLAHDIKVAKFLAGGEF